MKDATKIIFIALLVLYVTIVPILVDKYINQAQQELVQQIIVKYDSIHLQSKQIDFNF